MAAQFPYFQKNRIYVGLFPHQRDVRAHSHPFYELVFFEYGLLNHQWEGKRSILSRGDLFCISPGDVHQYTRSKDAKLYNCLFFPDAIPSGIEGLPGVKELLSDQVRVRMHVPVAMQQELKGILQRMIRELEHKASGYNEALSMLLGLLLVFAGRLYANFQVQETSYAPAGKLREALAYLEDNFAQQLKIEDVAQDHGLSPDQFSRLTRQLVGISPLQYLQNIRLSQAMELLLDENLQIAEIAFQVGFEDPNYFSRIFRRSTGQSPTQFRTGKGL